MSESDVVMNPTKSLLSKDTFQQLWIVSFAYSKCVDIEPLSHFACLGFVDVSYSLVDLKQVQELSRKTHMLRFHYFGSPIEDLEHHRGFIIKYCPRIWILNGVYVGWSERLRWIEHFEKTKYSIVERKWKLDEQVLSKPTELRWTEAAHHWLDDCPKTFHMAVDFHLWKLTKLACSLEGHLDIQNNALVNMLASVEPNDSSELKVIVCLLLVASFLGFPTLLLQQTFTLLLPQLDLDPFCWKPKDRASLLSLLIGAIDMDLSSIVNRQKQKVTLTDSQMLFLQFAVSSIYWSFYPKSFVGQDFDFDVHVMESNVSFQARESKLRGLHYDWLRFIILELICMGANDASFVAEFDKVYGHYEAVAKNHTSDYIHKIKARPLELKLRLLLSIRKINDAVFRV